MSFTITSLTKANLKFKIYIKGLSGAGKTFNALLLARGICPTGRIGIIDTLGGQANQYADSPIFGDVKTIQFDGPFTHKNCIEAIEAARADKWEVIIFDTMSNHHDGEGGQLQRAEEEEASGVKGLGKWNRPKMETRKLMSLIRDSSDFHFIGTYLCAETTDMKTKTTMVSPIQTKGSESYFTFHIEVTNEIKDKIERHPATWWRIPNDYRDCIVQGEEITIETGKRLAAITGVAPMPEPEIDPDLDILQLIDSHAVETEWFNNAIKLTYNGKYETWMELPDDHKRKLSVETSFLKIVAKGLEMKKQEGKS